MGIIDAIGYRTGTRNAGADCAGWLRTDGSAAPAIKRVGVWVKKVSSIKPSQSLSCASQVSLVAFPAVVQASVFTEPHTTVPPPQAPTRSSVRE